MAAKKKTTGSDVIHDQQVNDRRIKSIMKALYMKEDTNMTRIYGAIYPVKYKNQLEN